MLNYPPLSAALLAVNFLLPSLSLWAENPPPRGATLTEYRHDPGR